MCAMMLTTFLLAVQVTQAVPAGPPAVLDTAMFPSRQELLRLYTNCNEPRWPWGMTESLVTKTPEELVAGVSRRRSLEARWRADWTARAGDSIPPTATPASWVYPLEIRGRLVDNFRQPRVGGPHEALDVFVPHEGTVIRAPVSALVIAAGDGWQGRWRRRVGLVYEGEGLSRRAGNGVMLFEPVTGAYFYLIHMQSGSVAVRAGDVVRAGQVLGLVGHTGNASQPGHGRHLHFAYKQPGIACAANGVLVAVNPYRWVRAARSRVPKR
jgi:murein DD-endopeptidase MepM/ murein hydrolase activator NlpD